jgi:hypothetical protein
MQTAVGVRSFPRSCKAPASILLGLGIAVVVFALPNPAAAQMSVAGHDFEICTGRFALCAASTCTPTGRQITVNVTAGGTAQFPEADCTCPILDGPAVADLTGGNMQGSCEPPSEDQIWSTFQPRSRIPQAVANWRRAPAVPLICPAKLGLGDQSVNCFSFACDLAEEINGVPVATCHCALGESEEGTPVPKNTTFVTQAGQGDIEFCAKHPVSGTLTIGGTSP